MKSEIKKYLELLIILVLENQVRRLLKKNTPLIVAIGGSVGKTSTKAATATVLSEKYSVLAHPGNFNTLLSLPLAIFDQPLPKNIFNPLNWVGVFWDNERVIAGHYPYQALVLELGTDKPGEINRFMSYLHPHVGIITAVTPEHMEGFGTMEAVLEEEFDLARGSQKALINAGDVLLNMKKKEISDKPLYSFGVDKGDFWFHVMGSGKSYIEGDLHLPDKVLKDVKVNIIARHGLYAATAAVATGSLLGLSEKQIRLGIQNIKPVNGRMNPLPGVKGTLVIDDSYNSSPDAAMAALDSLKRLPVEGRKFAILGSMNELGEYSKEAHQNVGRWCADIDYLVTIGEDAEKYIVPAAKEVGLGKDKIQSFRSPYDAGEFVKKMLRKGDTILVKGSQNKVFAEEAVKVLLAKPDDAAYLVRQSSFWMKIKNQQFPRKGVK